MSANEWGPPEWLLLAFSTVVAGALPLATRLRFATPSALRERVLFSRPRAVVSQTIATCVGACVIGLLFGLGGARFPVLWGTVLVAVGALSASLWYALLYHRMVHQMEAEVAAQFEVDRGASHGESHLDSDRPGMYSRPWAWLWICVIGIGSGAAAGVGAYVAGVHPGWSIALGVGALILSGGGCATYLYDPRP